MKYKVLIALEKEAERAHFEDVLQEIVQKGVELFFAFDLAGALLIIEKEKPSLAFVQSSWLSNESDWQKEGVHLVQVAQPLKARQILEKCHEVLGSHPSGPLSLPM